MDDNNSRVSIWGRFIGTIASATSKIVWSIVALIVIATIGRYIYSKNPPQRGSQTQYTTERRIPPPISWQEVDAAISEALKSAASKAEAHATTELGAWTAELQKRIDEDFLEWYFSYWQQQWMGLKALGYWIADSAVIEKIIGEQPTMAEQITEDIQEEFSKRVLRPQIAQMQMERIAQDTVSTFVEELQKDIAAIPSKFKIPAPEWERYLNDLALISASAEGSREVPVTLKTLYVAGATGTIVIAGKVTESVKPMIARIGSRMSTRAAAKGAGKASAKVASKTGGKVAARGGGKFLGPIIGLGVIIWDVWDHQHTKKIERPILRQSLADYLIELQHSLLRDSDSGVMAIVYTLQSNVVSTMKHTKPNQPSEGTR